MGASFSDQLTKILNEAQSRTNDDVVREYDEGSDTTFVYDARGNKRAIENRIRTIEIAVGEADASKAIISIEKLEGAAPAISSVKSLENGRVNYSIKDIGDGYQRLEISTSAKGQGFAVLETEALTQLAANDNGVFVYANQEGASKLIQIAAPQSIPQKQNLYVKTFDVSLAFKTDRYSPIVVGFGKFLVLGGSHLGILNTNTGIYVKLKLPEDTSNSIVLKIEVEQDGRILKVTRAVKDPYSISLEVKKTTLDLARLPWKEARLEPEAEREKKATG